MQSGIKPYHILSTAAVVMTITLTACGTMLVSVATPTAAAPSSTNAGNTISGPNISYRGISLILPEDLGTGAQAAILPNDQANSPFDVYPTRTRFILQNYPLQGKAFPAQILIFPAQEAAQMSAETQKAINDLQNILAAQRMAPPEPIPFLPDQHAAQVFHAQEKFLSFQNGSGIRYITQFAQGPLPVNNKSLIYTFQGLTNDGAYYVSVILPVNLPYLPADESPSSQTPAGGISMDWEHPEKFPDYLNAMIDRLNCVDNAFMPSLESMDTLAQSMELRGQK